MAAKYYVTLTEYGSSLIEQTHDGGTIELKDMVIGDANGVPYLPFDNKHLTALVHQVASVPINEVKIIHGGVRISALIPASMGGFDIHEIGFTDITGKLVYLGNYHGAHKPVISDGGGGDLEIVADVKVSASKEVTVTTDPSILTANKAWVQTQLDELRNSLNPFLARTGSIELWSNPVPPAYALECDGAAYSRTDYKALFDVIGTAFGAGNGSTTFNVPDFRAEVPRGWDHGRGIDSGRILGSSQAASSVYMGDPSLTAGRVANLYNKTDDSVELMRKALNGEPTTVNATNLSVLSVPAEIVDPETPQNTTMSVRVRNVAVMFIIRI